jgi:hypothetical protein
MEIYEILIDIDESKTYLYLPLEISFNYKNMEGVILRDISISVENSKYKFMQNVTFTLFGLNEIVDTMIYWYISKEFDIRFKSGNSILIKKINEIYEETI